MNPKAKSEISEKVKKQLTNNKQHDILSEYVAKRKQSSLSPQRSGKRLRSILHGTADGWSISAQV